MQQLNKSPRGKALIQLDQHFNLLLHCQWQYCLDDVIWIKRPMTNKQQQQIKWWCALAGVIRYNGLLILEVIKAGINGCSKALFMVVYLLQCLVCDHESTYCVVHITLPKVIVDDSPAEGEVVDVGKSSHQNLTVKPVNNSSMSWD